MLYQIPQRDVTRVAFTLVEGYSSLALFSALETLRIANQCLRDKRFAWELCSEDGLQVSDSLGIVLPDQFELDAYQSRSIVLVCSGDEVSPNCSDGLLHKLRRLDRLGCELGGLYTGAYILAKAGILDGKQATIHWSNRASFAEQFPEVELVDQNYVKGTGVHSTASDLASIDLMLELIQDRQGAALAEQVAGRMAYRHIHSMQNLSRVNTVFRDGIRHPKLAKVVSLMECSIETPVSSNELALKVNISTRQLERLFQKFIGASPKRYYVGLQLEHANQLLHQTDMPISEVALASGFNSQSHFSKVYRGQYGLSPYAQSCQSRHMPSAADKHP